MQLVKATTAYFLLVFGAGFVLGAARVLLVVPRVGERAAELLEMPLMFAVIGLSARWLVRRISLPGGTGAWLKAGLAAAALVVTADLIVGVGLRGMSVRQVFLERDPVSGVAYYTMIAVYAAAPWVVASLRRVENR